MAKQLNVSLSLTADTNKIKTQLDELQTQLSQLLVGTRSNSGLGITKEIQEASTQVAALKVKLQECTNINTGKLDLGKFSQSLSKSNMDITKIKTALETLGPSGTKAFSTLAKSISTAEIPMRTISNHVKELGVTLKNTARWQISSSILHGFMGTLSSAYGYAQRLNDSLNEIRIVTGQSEEQMAKFAAQANKAAQSLSSTTTAYTNAALIFYQQGLDDKAVKERTDTVIKLSNVTGDSAKDVSSYMTAIWENFDDGSKSLEYYADVITRLGADTAASSAEIAEGLESFASIGNTIGLSYEYATSALTTIVAKTRASASEVGNGLRTIFSRLQNLSLGETLDDGTDLTKYSKALAAVGVNIKDASGELKSMDDILDDLAGKWNTLDQAEKVALANTVGGVRQYTKLISLMDNWDFMKQNITSASNSEGSLQEQADIYAESWEAAKDRVTAAAEEIYHQLLDDKFFISLTNGFSKFLNTISNVIDSLGGLKGVLLMVGTVLMTVFKTQAEEALTNLNYNLQRTMQLGKDIAAEKIRSDTSKALANHLSGNAELTGEIMANAYGDQAVVMDEYEAKVQKMTEEQQKIAEILLKQHNILVDSVVAQGELAEAAKKNASAVERKQNGTASENNVDIVRKNDKGEVVEITKVKAVTKEFQTATKTASAFQEVAEKSFGSISSESIKAGKGVDTLKARYNALRTTISSEAGMIETFGQEGADAFKELDKAINSGDPDQMDAALDKLMSKVDTLKEKANGLRTELDQNAPGLIKEEDVTTLENAGVQMGELTNRSIDCKVATENFGESLNQIPSKVSTGLASLTNFAQKAMAVSMAISSIKGLIDTWNNEDLSFGDKLLSTFTTLGMVIPMVTAAISADTAASLANTIAKKAAAAAGIAEITLKTGETVATGAKTVAESGETAGIWAKVAAKIAELAVSWPLLAVTLLLVAAITALAAIIWLVASAFQSLSNLYNADAVAAEKAEAGARGLADAYDEVRQKYESLIEAMDNYQSAREALDNLTEGTNEYKEALQEANAAALELINQTSGLIRGQDYDWENGQLIINEDALSRVKNTESMKVANAQSASIMANAKAAQLRAISDTTDFKRSDNLGTGGAIAAGIASAITLSLSGPLGLIGTALLGGRLAKDAQGDKEQQAQVDALAESYRKLGEAAFDTEKLEELGIDTANAEYVKSIKEVAKATAEAADQMENSAREAAQSVMAEQQSFQNSQYQDKVSNIGGKREQELYNEAFQKYTKMTKNNDWFGIGSSDNKKAFAEYASQMGLDQLNDYKVKNYKKGGNVEYSYIDDEGKKQTKEVTQDQIAMQLAATEAAKALGQETEELVKAFNKLENSTDMADQALSDFLGGDLENSNKAEFSAIANKMNIGIGEAIDSTDANDYLANVIGDGDGILTDEEAKKMGYESADAMITAFVEEFNESSASWESIEIPNGLNKVLADGMSLATAQAIENTTKNLNLGPMGKQAGEEFINGLNLMLADVNSKDQQAALSKLMDIDWSSWDALKQADKVLKEFGVDIDTASDEWQSFAANMQIAAGASPDFSQLKENLIAISKILQDLDFGSTISDEDYQTLVAYNDEWERFFLLQADGTRKFIGNSATMLQSTRNQINADRKALQERSAAQAGFKAVGWGHEENGARVDANWATKSGSDHQTAQNLLNASGATEEALKQLGYTDDIIQAILDKANSSEQEAVKQGEAQLEEMYRRIDDFLNEDMAEADAQLDEMMASTAQNVAQLNELYQNGDITSLDAYNKQLQYLNAQLAGEATTLQELDAAIGQGELNHIDESYTQNLMRLAEGYDSCSTALESYQAALSQYAVVQENGSEEDKAAAEKRLEAAEDTLRAAIKVEEAAEKYDLEANSLKIQAEEIRKASQEAADGLELTAEQAVFLAIQNQRLNKGLIKLVDNWDDWKKALKNTDKTSQDYADTLADLSAAVTDIVGWYDDLALSSEFVAENMDLIEKSSQGDLTAIMQLGAAVAKYTVAQSQLDMTLAEGKMSDGTLNALQKYAELLGEGTTAADAFKMAQTGIQEGFDTIANNMERLQNGATLAEVFGSQEDLNNWITQLNAYAAATGMTAQQMQDMLSSVGVTANVQTDYQEQEVTVPTYREEITAVNYRTIKGTHTDENGHTEEGPSVTIPEYTKASVPDKPLTTTGYVEVASISMDGEGEGPSVSPPTFTGRQAPAPSAKQGSSGSGKGGGGSSSSTEHNNEKHKDPTDEKERYHVIKNQLEDLTSQYDRISKAKDKAFGSARLANLNKEIAAQKKLTQVNKQYLDEIESYLAQDKGTMASYGAIFDNNGTILNYDELVKQQVDAYNAAVDTFNNAYTDDEGAKAAFEAAQEVYDKFQDALSQYEETQDLFNEQTQTYIDSLNAERELLLERTQLQVELKVNVEEDALNFLQYALDNIENKAYDCAEAFGYLNDMTAAYLGTARAYEEGLRSLFANQGLSDADFDSFINGNSATFNTLSQMLSDGESAGFQSEDVETIRNYIKELISANENLQEVRQTVHDQILTVWDEWNEKLDDNISKLEHLQAIQESYVNIIDIVGQKNLGVSNAFMRSLSQQGIDQANDKLVAEKARYDALKKARDDAYATFEEQKNKGILSEEEIKMWEDSLRQMDEDVRSASEDFQSAWEDALTSINEAFEAEVDRIIEAYDDAAAGLMGSMSQLQEAFDRKSDLADQYLDDYEKIYQFSKLNRDIENSIDSTSNVKAKKELLELQSKINAYEEAGTEISEYQMQQLQQEYELKKAQIELEEASEAKSQVKMQRDSEGNYSYVYTANSDDVAKAEQNYEDKLHAMQQSNAEYINDLQSNMIQMEQDYQDKVKEIMTDTSLTAEERMAQLNELNDYYDEKMKFYISEAQLWEQNSQILYEKDWMNYATMTGYKISEEDKWLDHWNETQLALLTGFETLEDYQTNHNINVANLLLASGEAFSTWQANIEEAMNNAGTSLGTFEEDATDAMQTVAEESEKTKDQMVNDSKDMVDAVNDVVAAVSNWETQYSKVVQGMLDRNTALAESFRKLIAEWSKFEAAENAHNSSSGNDNSSGSGSGSSADSGNESGSSGSGSGSGADNSDKIEGVAAAIWMDGSAAGWGNGSTRRQRLQEKGVSGAQDYINAHASNGDIYSAWASKRGQLRQFYYGSFDTGGYTGEWGLDGKLALLHEKELVLNADDTTNFLKAIDVVRQISDMIDLNALSSAGGLSSLFAATASSSSQNLQQEVHITAEFPNATDKDQISEAFSDLVNLASQYANRK